MGAVRRCFVNALAMSILCVVQASAQVADMTRFTIVVAPIRSQPKAEFSQNVGSGLGVGGGLLYHVDRPGVLSLRFDTSWLAYGREKKRVPLSETIGGRILTDVTTTNSITAFSFGPEIALPRGKVRPYLNAALSSLLFRTNSSLNVARASDENIANTTNLSDLARAWVLGSGVRIPLPRRISQFSLDIGARYHRGGQASYLREGSIQDQPDGSILFTPLTSRTSHLVYLIGVRFRIPFNSTRPCQRFLC